MKRFAVLFVCMGNICRSPTAHGVFRHKLQAAGLDHAVHLDSAGTHNYHSGSSPDARAQACAAERGYDLSDLRARQIKAQDFGQFDLILVMDYDNLALVQSICPCGGERKIRRLTEFCQTLSSPVVPDPYYGGGDGFKQVLDLVDDACEGLLQHVRRQIR